MDGARVRELLRAGAFAHPVGDLRLIETHISWIVLTGDYAYKIKKPVEMGFLDFSSLDSRRHFCREELRLNRRLAPELYLDVAEITADDGGAAIDGAGEVIDYAVRMRQFDQRRLASRTAAEGRLTPARCRDIGRTIARFHNGLEPVRPDAPDGPGTPTAIFAAARQNFRQIDDALPPEAAGTRGRGAGGLRPAGAAHAAAPGGGLRARMPRRSAPRQHRADGRPRAPLRLHRIQPGLPPHRHPVRDRLRGHGPRQPGAARPGQPGAEHLARVHRRLRRPRPAHFL